MNGAAARVVLFGVLLACAAPLASVAKAWAPFFEGPEAPFAWKPDVVEVLESGELALSSGPVRNASSEEIGRFNSIWRKDADDEWRVIFDKGS